MFISGRVYHTCAKINWVINTKRTQYKEYTILQLWSPFKTYQNSCIRLYLLIYSLCFMYNKNKLQKEKNNRTYVRDQWTFYQNDSNNNNKYACFTQIIIVIVKIKCQHKIDRIFFSFDMTSNSLLQKIK